MYEAGYRRFVWSIRNTIVDDEAIFLSRDFYRFTIFKYLRLKSLLQNTSSLLQHFFTDNARAQTPCTRIAFTDKLIFFPRSCVNGGTRKHRSVHREAFYFARFDFLRNEFTIIFIYPFDARKSIEKISRVPFIPLLMKRKQFSLRFNSLEYFLEYREKFRKKCFFSVLEYCKNLLICFSGSTSRWTWCSEPDR